MQSFESAKSKIISSALGKALGMTASTALAAVADKIAAVIDRSTTIQTATTSTANQNASCFRTSGTNIEVIPAKGLWNNWDWAKSCIRITAASLGITAAKIVKGNTIVGIAGTDAGYTAGYNSGVSAGQSNTINGLKYYFNSATSGGSQTVSCSVTVPSSKKGCIIIAFYRNTQLTAKGTTTVVVNGSTAGWTSDPDPDDINRMLIYVNKNAGSISSITVNGKRSNTSNSAFIDVVGVWF